MAGEQAGLAGEVSAAIDAENSGGVTETTPTDALDASASDSGTNDRNDDTGPETGSARSGDPVQPPSGETDETPTGDGTPEASAEPKAPTPEETRAAIDRVLALAAGVQAPQATDQTSTTSKPPAGPDASGSAGAPPSTTTAGGFDASAFTKVIDTQYGPEVAAVFKPLADAHASTLKDLADLKAQVAQFAPSVEQYQQERQAANVKAAATEFERTMQSIKGSESVFGKTLDEARADPKKAEMCERAWNLSTALIRNSIDPKTGRFTITPADAFKTAMFAVLGQVPRSDATQQVRAAVVQRSKQRTLAPSTTPRRAAGNEEFKDDGDAIDHVKDFLAANA